MADAPAWGFPRLGNTTRWILGHGLPTTLEAPTAPLDSHAWAAMLSECASHRLQGHLIAAVVDGSLPTTADQLGDAAEVEVDLTRQRARYDEVCQPVLEILDEAGIRFRLIKGSALPWTYYPDPQARPTADLDLLVPGAELHDAVGVLVDHGGELFNPEPTPGFARLVFKGLTVTMPSGLEVDLHRLLSWGPLGVRVPEADLWAPGLEFDRLGRIGVTLDVNRSLVHMCAHLLLLGAIRASEVRDVAQLATAADLDASQVLEIARRWGQEAILAVALRMVERELGLRDDAHPLHEWAAAYQVNRLDKVWLRIDRPDAPVRRVEPAAVLWELRGIQARRTMIRALIAPIPDTDPRLGDRIRDTIRSRRTTR